MLRVTHHGWPPRPGGEGKDTGEIHAGKVPFVFVSSSRHRFEKRLTETELNSKSMTLKMASLMFELQ